MPPSILLFVYGTLGPNLDAPSEEWTTDAVRGRLYDLGEYPVLVDWMDETAGWVEGHVRLTDDQELVDVLDPYECVDDGLFERVRLRTRNSLVVWAYVYPRDLPEWAKPLTSRWNGPRRGRLL